MKITTSYENLREFVSFHHLFQYGNSAIFDRIAIVAQSGIETETLAIVLWAASNCDQVDGLSLMHDKVCAWFCSDSPENVSRANHPELVSKIATVAAFHRDAFHTPVNEHNIVLLDSFSTGDVTHSVNFSVEGRGYHIDFDEGTIERNEFYNHARERI